jgi:hypothetical protein
MISRNRWDALAKTENSSQRNTVKTPMQTAQHEAYNGQDIRCIIANSSRVLSPLVLFQRRGIAFRQTKLSCLQQATHDLP